MKELLERTQYLAKEVAAIEEVLADGIQYDAKFVEEIKGDLNRNCAELAALKRVLAHKNGVIAI